MEASSGPAGHSRGTQEQTSNSGLSACAGEQGRQGGKCLVRSCNYMAFSRKNTIKSQLCPGSKPISSLGVYAGSIAEPEAPDTLLWVTYLQAAYKTLPTIYLTSFHMHLWPSGGTSALLKLAGKPLGLDPKCSFTCRCCTFACIHFTHSRVISTGIM